MGVLNRERPFLSSISRKRTLVNNCQVKLNIHHEGTTNAKKAKNKTS